jgi:hypothetical protein
MGHDSAQTVQKSKLSTAGTPPLAERLDNLGQMEALGYNGKEYTSESVYPGSAAVKHVLVVVLWQFLLAV